MNGIRFILFLIIFSFNASKLNAQFLVPSDSLNKKRLIAVSAIGAASWTGSIGGLYFVWYKDFPKTGFHVFNDNQQWQHMDKMGHLYISHHVGRFVGDLYEWSGLNHKKASIIGAGVSLGYMSTFELLDATNEQWGFSWGDMGYNTLGAVTYWGQEYFFNKQYVQFKFSAHHSGLAEYRPEVLGSNATSRMLKDYNGQTYWMSFNPIYWFKKESKFPEWINLSLGYSINNQLIGDGGTFVYTDGITSQSFTPYKQYFLSFDVNFEAIPTDRRWLKLIFRGLNYFKVPFPALEFSQGKVGFRPFYF
ncbi:YfiM family protein [Paracrocinitomix mangrovi]|uniref:DUF2279 domain-containing protein n=1 Tax=Paracrocinitomix mangrovi TaxID=2862509 RepID=UPI001C8F0A66|nr:DUF2279 domain-containing protein [Paracrocinitomix mangrovi]UKN00916.1 YfiM family protein [Paracrocinitomix mangrovi]